jgi:hypothetical protein
MFGQSGKLLLALASTFLVPGAAGFMMFVDGWRVHGKA